MYRSLGTCLLVVPAALFWEATAVRAAAITAIAPTCAPVGAEITITGSGFDAGALGITVGGVTATLGSISSGTASFSVPAGVALGPTTVTAVNPSSTGSIAFRVCDLLMPASWGGQWQMTVSYTDAATNNPVETDQIATYIRAGEPFGLAGAANIGSCSGSVTDAHLAVQCTGQGAIATCAVASSVQISADLAGDSISGSGVNTATLSGACGPFTTSVQNIQIAGTRISQDQNLNGPPLTLLASFVPFASSLGGGAAVDVSSQMAVSSAGFLFSRATRLYAGTLTARNAGSQTIAGPIQIVLTNLTPGVTVANATGMANGNPFLTIPASIGLPPGQSAIVNVQFNNPSNALIKFTALAYTGSF